MDSAHPDTVNSWLSRDELFSLRVKCATDAETPELALCELFHVRRSAGSPRLRVQYVLDCLLGAGWGTSLLSSSAALSHCVIPLRCILMASFTCILYYMWFQVTRLYNPFGVWARIIKSGLLPAVSSLHFLCPNLLGNYIKSRNKIKNANFKVATYMRLQN